MDSLPAEPPGKPKNTGVGSLSLLQQIFPNQESNWGLLHCRQILSSSLSYNGSLGTIPKGRYAGNLTKCNEKTHFWVLTNSSGREKVNNAVFLEGWHWCFGERREPPGKSWSIQQAVNLDESMVALGGRWGHIADCPMTFAHIVLETVREKDFKSWYPFPLLPASPINQDPSLWVKNLQYNIYLYFLFFSHKHVCF